MSQKTGNILIVIVVVIISLFLWGNHYGGRTIDYQEQQMNK